MKSFDLFIKVITGVTALLSLSSCNGIFGGIYDQPDAESEFGFIETDEASCSGTIYVDASSYTDWYYIDFHSESVMQVPIREGAHAPSDWDFAIHRYDAKTNSGAVLQTECTELTELEPSDLGEPSDYVKDIWTEEKIIIDMSQMMNGIIGYTKDYYNEELSLWLDVDKSEMPPIYTLSGKVYILALEDGTRAALKLVNFMNDAGDKGFMRIRYIYPLEK